MHFGEQVLKLKRIYRFEFMPHIDIKKEALGAFCPFLEAKMAIRPYLTGASSYKNNSALATPSSPGIRT
jgi:hypothetical protein